MGVDYGGSGPIYALGPGVITENDTSWAGGFGGTGRGTFIAERLTSGPLAGQYIYVAENINPVSGLHVGQRVTSGTILGNVTGGIETGFAAPPGTTGITMAAKAGQIPSSGDPGARPTAYGEAYNKILASLGAPPGTVNGQPTGSASNIQTTSFTSSIIGGLLNALGLGNDLKGFFIRAGLIALGGILLIAGIIMIGKKSKGGSTDITNVIPAGGSSEGEATEAAAAA